MSPLDREEVWRDSWAALGRASRDPRHAFRHPVVASHAPRPGVRARTVVLRDADPEHARLVFYTDRRSGKIGALESEPFLSWCFYDPRHRIQLRAETRAALHAGDEVARAAWQGQGPEARALYAVEPAPGTPLAAGEAPGRREGADAGFASFVVVVCTATELDWLRLDREGHLRLRFAPGPAGWTGTSVVP